MSSTVLSIYAMLSFAFEILTFNWLSFSMLRIHLLACPCGSIINGQREVLKTTMPFSTLKVSVGKPCMFQSRINTSSPKVVRNDGLLLHGILLILHNLTQPAINCPL